MTVDEKVALLKQSGLLKLCEETTLKALAENCREVALEENELLFEEGTPEKEMYIILSGELLIFKGKKQIARLGQGQCLGEMSLIESEPRSASVRSVKDTLLMQITENQFKTFFLSEPTALLSLIRTLSGRIRNDLHTMSREFRTISIYTHDIKNCLTPLGLTELYLNDVVEKLSSTPISKDNPEELKELRKCADVLSNTRKNLLTLLETSLCYVKKLKLDYVKTKAKIIPLIEETVEEIMCHKYLTRRTVKVKKVGKIREARFNSLDIKRVLQNLIINAGWATEEGGTITIQVQNPDANIHVSVIDRGCGIPEEVRPYLLKEPFTTKEDGNGLGLLSCQEVIEHWHQGKFWYETEVGRGTTFHFTIPNNPPEGPSPSPEEH